MTSEQTEIVQLKDALAKAPEF